MQINKDTKIFCSFSKTPGNNGCFFFNEKFKENKLNAIYKSFYSDDIVKSINAVKALDICGFAVSMPFKKEIIKYVDEVDEVVKKIGSCNTVINSKGYLKAFNTDWIGVKKFFLQFETLPSKIVIAGNGGFSNAAQYAFQQMKISYAIVKRDNWHELDNTSNLIFNATPVQISNKNLIDARPSTKHGKIIAMLQAEEQFKLYTKWI